MDVAERTVGRIYAPPKLPRGWLPTAGIALAVVMLFLPQIVPAGDMRTVNITGLFCLTIVGLDLLTGIAGQVSLGQAGFMAIGGYTSAILAVHYGVPTLVGLVAGACASALVAAVLGIVCGRLRGMYLAIVTLAFGILVEALANGLNITGGPSGIAGIPPFSVAGYAFDNDNRVFYLVWALVAVALVLSVNLVRSSRGRILRAMHGDQVGARSLGLHVTRAKVAVFVISACMASVSGSLYASYFRYLSPDQVGSAQSLTLITMLAIGGMGTLFGPLIGVALLTYLPLVSQSIASYTMLVTGVLLVVFLRYLPAGIWGAVLEGVTRARAGWSGQTGRLLGRLQRPAGGTDPAVAAAAADPVGAPAASPAVSANGKGSPDRSTAGDPTSAADGKVNASGSRRDGGLALEVRGLSKSFGGVAAVRDASFAVPEGSLTALIGPNGAGKSTMFNLVTNLYRPESGEVILRGQPITGLRSDRITALGLFRTFQTARVFPQLSVLDNVLVGGYRLGKAGYLSQSLRLRRSRQEERQMEARARRLLEVMGLADRADQRAAALPLAAQKYLELARALMARPSVVLFDEPAAGMNDAETAELGLILRAIRDTGHTVVVVEHNMSLVMGVCDQVVVMDAGSVIAAGPPQTVQNDPLVISAYFGAAEANT
jgi:ABC-type branched-subunit amino acid transport system ATPase component/ABC-type branched-subunit amino acid transport system permease subunit